MYCDDITGLYITRNRVYDPRTAAWLSPDPMGDQESVNRFGFVGQMPHEKTDPLGLEASLSQNGTFAIANPKGGRIRRISPQWAREHPSGVWYALKGEGDLSDEAAEELIRKAGLPVVRGGLPCRPGETCLVAGPKDRGVAYDAVERTAAVPICTLSGFMNNVDAVMGQGPPVPCPIGPPNSERQEQFDKAILMLNVVSLVGARGGPGRISEGPLPTTSESFPTVAEFSPSTGRTYKVFQRGDINWNQIRQGGPRDFIGKTNAEAAQQGLRPELPDLSFATIHHAEQNAAGPWFEASTRYHNITTAREGPLHPYGGQQNPYAPLGRGSGSLRDQFQTIESPEYWIWREAHR